MLDLRNDTRSFRNETSPPETFGKIFFSVPFDKETVKYVLHDRRPYPAAKAQASESPDYSGITRGYSSELIYKVDSTCRLRGPERPAAEDARHDPSIEMLHNRNMIVLCARKTKSALLCVYCIYPQYDVERNILACVDCSNLFYSR